MNRDPVMGAGVMSHRELQRPSTQREPRPLEEGQCGSNAKSPGKVGTDQGDGQSRHVCR